MLAYLHAAGFSRADENVGGENLGQSLCAVVRSRVRGKLHALAIVRRGLFARLRFAGLPVDDADAPLSKREKRVDATCVAFSLVDQDQFAGGEREARRVDPVKDGADVGIVLRFERLVVERKVERIVDSGAKVGRRLDLGEGGVHDALSPVLDGFRRLAGNGSGCRNSLLDLPVFQAGLCEHAENRGHTRVEME